MAPGALPDPIAVAVLVVRRLDEQDVPYVVGGSFASSLHGEPRSTNDVDVVADLDAASARRLVESLGSAFYADADVAAAAAASGGSFNVIHVESAVKVDVFVVGNDPLDRERLRRRERVTIESEAGDAQLYIDTPEDVVLRKLEWYRRSGQTSERQWRDVLAVLRVQRSLDREYLDKWADRLGLSDLLARAMVEAVNR